MKKLFLLLLLPTVAWADQPVGYNATTGKVSPNVPMEFQKTLGYTRSAIGNIGSTEIIDWNKPVSTFTIDQNCTITFSNLPAAGVYRAIQLVFVNNGFALTWPASVTPAGPGINSTVGSVTWITAATLDGGTTVYWWSDGQDNPAMSAGTVTFASTTNINFNGKTIQSIALTGDITFTTSNVTIGKGVVVKLTSDASIRSFTFPGTWTFIGTTAPASIAASKKAVLSLTAFGSGDSNVIAAYAVEP